MSAPRPQAASAPPPLPAKPRPEILVQVDKFWHRVTEGLELAQLWSQFKSDARASYRLYSRDYKVSRSQDTRKRTGFQVAQEFAWALLEKLSPARRVLLLAAMLMLFFGGGQYSWEDKAGH